MSAQPKIPEKIVTLEILKPDSTAADLANAALAAANARLIANDADYVAATDELKAIKGKWNRIEAQRKDLLTPVDESRKRIMDFFRSPLDFLSRAEGILKGKIVDYQQHRERIRLDEQRKLEAEAQRERDRLAEQARETERKAREKAEADRKAAAEAEAAGRAAEAAKLNARANAAEQRGTEKAVALEQRASTVVAPIVQTAPPKVAGMGTREVWKYRIKDRALIPDEYKVIDEKRIAGVVRSLKGDTKIPGVEVYPDQTIASRS